MMTLMRIFAYIAIGVVGIIATFRSIGVLTKLVSHIFNRIDHEIEKAIEE